MKSKLKFLTKMSLKRKIATKWFLIANIILAVVIMGVINIDSIITFFGGNFSEKTKIMVIDNTNKSFELLKNNYDTINAYVENMTPSELIKYEKSLDEAKAEVNKDSNKVVLVLNNDETNILAATLISKSKIDALLTQSIVSSVSGVKRVLSLEHYNISAEMMAKIDAPITIDKQYLDDSKTTDEMMELVMGSVFPALILPFFMLTMFLVQMIGAEVNEEKTTKGMEIIISNVSPKTHFFSKIIAGNIFVGIQGVLLVIFVGLGLLIRSFTGGNAIANGLGSYAGDVLNQLSETGILDKLIYIIPITLVLMILSFIAYSLVAGILASMTTNIEDYQQVQTPIILISVIGYYLSIMAGIFDGSTFIRIASYIPFISALLTPALLVLGQVGIVDVIIAIALLVGTNYLLLKYGLKIYKVGILNYSSSNLWKKMIKAVKSKA